MIPLCGDSSSGADYLTPSSSLTPSSYLTPSSRPITLRPAPLLVNCPVGPLLLVVSIMDWPTNKDYVFYLPCSKCSLLAPHCC